MGPDSKSSDSHEFPYSADDPPSVAVVRAITDASGDDPDEMTPLYATLDPEALDALCRFPRTATDRSEVTVEFSFNGYRVRLGTGGNLAVSEE